MNDTPDPTRDSRLTPPASGPDPNLASRLSPLASNPCAVVAEDDEGLNRLICKHLERRGMKLVGVHSGTDAIAAIQEHPDCLLLLDYVLVDMDGRELLDKLNNMGLRVPFIVMTGRGDEQIAVEMMKLGARDYLVKQPDFLELVPPVVERVLGQLAMERQLGRAEQGLRESEERYRRIVETANEGIWALDADCGTTYANPRLAAMLGCTVEELLGRPTEDFMFPEDVPAHRERIARRRDGKSGTYEFRLRRKDGTECWALASASPVLDAQGRYAGSFAMLSDITEHKRAEEMLRESEERHRRMVELSPTGILTIDLKGTVTSANEAFVRLSGFPAEELVGRHFARLPTLVGQNMRTYITIFNRVLKGKLTGPTEFEWRHADGSTRAGEGMVSLTRNDRHVIGVQLVVTDITERKQAEAALRAEQERAQKYLDIASVMLVAMDTAGMVTLINRRGCEVLGWAEREAVGKDWFETFLPERTRTEMRAVFRRLLAGEQVGPEYTECLVLTRSGEERLIAWHDQLLHDEAGSVTGILSSGEDVTEHRRAEDALRASEERYRQLIDEMGEGIGMADTDEQFTFANRAAEELFGVPRGGLVGRSLFEFLSAEQADLVRGQTARRRTGVRGSYELTITRPDRAKRTALLTATPKHNAAGAYVGAFGIFRDITVRRQAEKELQAEKERAQKYLDVAGVMLVALDPRGRITLMNRYGYETLGYSEGELIGRSWADTCVPERRRNEVKGVFSWLVAGAVKAVEYFENPVVTRSGEERLIAWHNVVLRDESGRTTGILSSGEDITERRRAEHEAQAEREQLRRILDATPYGAYVVGRDHEIQYVNPYLLAERGPVDGRKCFNYFYGRTEPCPDCVSPQVLAGAAMRHEHVTQGGITFDVQDVPVTGNDGRPARLTFLHNITERRRAEHEAQAEREQLRRILDGMPDGAYVVGQDFELQYLNPSLLARGGPVNGRKCFDYFHGRAEPCPDCTNSQVFAGRGTRREYATRSGVTYDIQDVPVTGNDGRPARLAFMRDITERKQAEERDKQHLEDTALLRDTALGFITLDPEADIYRYVAQRLARLAGEAYIVVNSYDATRDEFNVRAIEGVGERAAATTKLLGRPPVGMVFKLAPKELRDYSGSTLMRIEGGLPALSLGKLPKVVIAAVESVFGPGDIYAMSFYWQEQVLGTVNIIMHRGVPLRDPAIVEAFVNQAAIALRRKRDADELERHRLHLEELVAERTRELTAAQEQLVLHGKLTTLGRVAGSVAHEIRNPLGAIKNASWLLRKEIADKLDGKPLRHLRLVDESIDTADRAIAAILDFTWRLQGEPKKCALRPMLERAVAETTMPDTVDVHFDVKPGLPHVLVDDRQIVAVFRNLFTNAAQAMPSGGTLRVAARRSGTRVEVDVADPGSGIKPEHLARVFEPLFTTKDIGIGLGLAICKDFVEANKGTISVVSEVGKGTTFTVTLPTAERDKP